MPLSEEEQRILQEIEANLTATDPGPPAAPVVAPAAFRE